MSAQLNTDLLPESESADFAGVSTDTLNQYARFGLIEKKQVAGENHFLIQELRMLFQVDESKLASPSDQEPQLDTPEPKSNEANITRPASELEEFLENYSADSISELEGPDFLKTSQREDGNSPESFVVPGQDLKSQISVEAVSAIINQSSPFTSETKPSSNKEDFSHVLELYKNQVSELQTEKKWLQEHIARLQKQLERQDIRLQQETNTVQILLAKEAKRWRLPLFSPKKLIGYIRS